VDRLLAVIAVVTPPETLAVNGHQFAFGNGTYPCCPPGETGREGLWVEPLEQIADRVVRGNFVIPEVAMALEPMELGQTEVGDLAGPLAIAHYG
jgi:hypothetical protein